MTAQSLPNYLRMYRKRSCLTQGEVAFILGTKSSAGISRHEQYKQTPDLETMLAYEMLFRTPARSLFGGMHENVKKKLFRRIKLLIRKLSEARRGAQNERKLRLLRQYLTQGAESAEAAT